MKGPSVLEAVAALRVMDVTGEKLGRISRVPATHE